MLTYFIWGMGILIALRFFMYIFTYLPQKHGISKKKPALAIRGYTLFYSDEKTKDKIEGVVYSQLLHSETYNICGKPDFIYKKKRGNKARLVPVELKSGTIGESDAPRPGDLMQLTAYFVIIEDMYGVRPLEGRLIYKDHMFVIKNTKKLRKRLFDVLWSMRDMLKTGEGEADNNFIHCKHCMCRGTVCEHV